MNPSHPLLLRSCKWLGAAVVGAAALLAVGCSNGAPTVPSNGASESAGSLRAPQTKPPVPIPSTGAYLGAWVNPSGSPHPSPSAIEQMTETLESTMGHPLALHMHYYPSFYPSQDVNNYIGSPNFEQEMTDDYHHGRIPVISMVCGDSLEEIYTELKNGTDKNGDKNAIDTAAEAIAALPTPVFVRFFWEFDIDTNGQTHNGDAENCFNTSLPLVATPIQEGTSRAGDFVAAWEQIHQEFQNKGATNVAWLWNPTGGSPTDCPNQCTGPNPLSMTENQMAAFLPPSSDVDWIGVDAYDWSGGGLDSTIGAFYKFYQDKVTTGQPILVGETGEGGANPLGTNTTTQSAYLSQALSELPGTYSAIKGLMYWDDVGQNTVNGTEDPWSLNTAGGNEWSTISKKPLFAPTLKNP